MTFEEWSKKQLVGSWERALFRDWKAERENTAKERTELIAGWETCKAEREEQDREIERLQKLEGIVQGMVKNWNEFEQPMPFEWDMPDPMRTIHEWASEWKGAAEKAGAKIKEQDREIERLRLDGWVDLSTILEYQRRHRKWALEKARANLEFYNLTYEHAQQFKTRAAKAEARIKELEQELLWAADACEKAEAEANDERINAEEWYLKAQGIEAELIQLRKYNDVLQSQRTDVYNEGVEDGKRQAEKEKV